MGVLNKLFCKKSPSLTAIQEIGKIIDRFATAASMGVDREDLARYPARQYKVMAFHYGAIDYLSEQYQLDETQKLGVFVVFLDSYFNMPITETGSISERLQGFLEKPDEYRFMVAGADACRRWHQHHERRAPLQLGELLKEA